MVLVERVRHTIFTDFPVFQLVMLSEGKLMELSYVLGNELNRKCKRDTEGIRKRRRGRR